MTDSFRSERLHYRAIEETDDPFLLRMDQDPESEQNCAPSLPVPRGKETPKKLRECFAQSMLAVLMYLPATGDAAETPIGVLTLDDANKPRGRRLRHAILAIQIDREHWRKGYGREAIGFALHWAFHRAGLHKVSLGTYEYNTRAIKLYESVGFKLDGKFRDDVWHEGRFWAECHYSILEDEWRELHGSKTIARAVNRPAGDE